MSDFVIFLDRIQLKVITRWMVTLWGEEACTTDGNNIRNV